MIRLEATVSKEAIAKIKAALERKLTKIQERIAIRTFNFIVDADIDYTRGPNVGSPARAPQWSGAFMASWNIQSGSIDTSSAIAPVGVRLERPIFPRAQEVATIAHTSYKAPIYISNSVQNERGESYAGQIENFGSPKHLGGWKIAQNAVNVARIFGV